MLFAVCRLHFFQILIRRSLNYFPQRVITRAVAGAIPAPFEGIPVQMAAEMGAGCGMRVELPGIVAIRCDLGKALPHDGPTIVTANWPPAMNVAETD